MVCEVDKDSVLGPALDKLAAGAQNCSSILQYGRPPIWLSLELMLERLENG